MTVAEQARDTALEQVERAADPAWLKSAWKAITFVAKRRTTRGLSFTTDDVWFRLEALKVDRPREPRALGPLIRRAVTEGYMEPTGSYRKSTRPECHARPVAVYEGTTL